MTGLIVRDLHAWYEKSHVLQGVDVQVQRGQTVAILGRNGAGKTTTLRSIMGLVHAQGTITFNGNSLSEVATHEIARRGLAFVPENRAVFTTLDVRENLSIAFRKGSPWTPDAAAELFPSLRRRWKSAAGRLSGGEQQMLAIARALMTNPSLLLLDEPTEGLAPVIVDELVQLMLSLKARGLTILLVEQSIQVCRAVADTHAILDEGRIVWTGTTASLSSSSEVLAKHLTLESA
ncbi:ABC transporter ATP-binding protein [Bradyrhizobium yuanmingense]|uniref:ABC transporter ATP-binding protein n=1 Tax=Bradyrhizobium yuanmingense TaxID=108015 RepID=UPI0023B9AA5A|nr:ABC transporter ATP-binding protein [Bradyrhizobium yuanmingense]MDF0520139.1 ABC transporter ATP-binding protein [Bradyrhizobium yuanmingense]